MFRKHLIALALITATSCIFGGGKEKNSAENNANNSNNANNVADGGDVNNVVDMGRPTDDMTTPPADMTVPPDDMTRPPDMGPEETYLSLDAEEVNCATPPTAWFAPESGDDYPPITDQSFVTTANAPREGLQTYLGSQASVAYATKENDGTISVFGAAVGASDASSRFFAVKAASADLEVPNDAVLYGVSLTSHSVDRNQGPMSDLLSIVVATSAGVYQCVVQVDMMDDAMMTCERSPWNQTVADLEIEQPARLDIAPIFERAQANYILSFLGFDIVAAASGPGANGGEVIGLLRSTTEGVVNQIDIVGVDTTLGAGTFGERLAFGVTSNSFAAPILLMLHNTPMRGLQPIALRSDDLNLTRYTPLTVGEWSLSSRISPTREGFTFVDEYDIDASPFLVFLGIQFPHASATARFGYVGISDDASGLVLSRPGGFGGQDFLEFDITNAFEVVAFKNIPVSAVASGRAPLAVIHGANRDRLALIDWGFSTDATYIDDLLAPSFAFAQGMAPNWWVDDSGTISMLAQRGTEWVVAAIAIPDLKNLNSVCP